MKVETPAALRFIIQEDIYLLPGDKTSPQPQPVSAPVEQTPVTIFKYLGANKKGFLILVNYTDQEFIADEHLTALKNILSRKEYVVDDIAILNLARHNDVGFEQMVAHFNPQKLLVLGKSAMPANMVPLPFNEIGSAGNCTALYSFSFDEMMDNTENKKAFWEKMKNL